MEAEDDLKKQYLTSIQKLRRLPVDKANDIKINEMVTRLEKIKDSY